jgi:2-oxoglutarate ferredoxin oxidoreductase subunit alpha
MLDDLSIRICGQAGQGIQSVSSMIGKIFSRQGYHVFINLDVESRIRGGHNFDQVRLKTKPVYAANNRIDILVALDGDAIQQDLPFLLENGLLLYDGEKSKFKSRKPNHVPVPLERLAVESGKDKIMLNTVATGAVFALLGVGFESLLGKLEEDFRRKGKAVVENNKKAAAAGYQYIRENLSETLLFRIGKPKRAKKRILLNGSQAIAVGAICAGLKFYSGYPMSPSTAIMEFVAAQAKDYGIILEPAEDEISAINMIIGASFAGVRSMTATSGGGFCLMAEGLGLAGMTETPAVVVVAQRPGPATGLPTRTEQSDLKFAIHAAQGEFPRAVFAPGHAEQAFHLMGKAFNLADKYQTPVIVLGDQHLNDSFFTVDRLEPEQIKIKRRHVMSDREIPSPMNYRRYAWHKSGVSPRILPGLSRAVLYADSDEHTEAGHITESAEVRTQMMKKRMQKLEGMKKEMASPNIHPLKQGDVVLLGWGSTYGAMKEAAGDLNAQGVATQMLHFSEIYPFPNLAFLKNISKKARIFAVESNYTGQFADIFRFETGRSVDHKILKYDGRPFTAKEIVNQIQNRL